MVKYFVKDWILQLSIYYNNTPPISVGSASFCDGFIFNQDLSTYGKISQLLRKEFLIYIFRKFSRKKKTFLNSPNNNIVLQLIC